MKSFGGELLKGKRKAKRPLSTKQPLHLILKSCEKLVFVPTNLSLEKLIHSQAQKFNLKIYELAINWSHIHLIIKIKERENYNQFIRSLCSILTAKIRAQRPHLKTLFVLRPFTRIISWGRDFKSVVNYLILNQMEAQGLIFRPKTKPQPKISSITFKVRKDRLVDN
ncbi:MAG: transposase [Pseudobdellovibrionaceae bacterium]